MFDLVININCTHLWDILPLISVTYCYILYEIADNDFIDCI